MVALGSTSALMGRAGFRLIHPMEFKNYPVVPYLRANFWSVLAGNRANPVIFADVDNIVSSAASNWAQLGGGLTVGLGHQLSLYAFVDDLVTVGSNQNSLTGIDGGFGLHGYW